MHLEPVPCTDLVLPHPVRRRARFVAFHLLPQQPPGHVVVARTAVLPVEQKGKNKSSKLVVCIGGAMKHVERRRERAAVFPERGRQPSEEACLRLPTAASLVVSLSRTRDSRRRRTVPSSHAAAPATVERSVPLGHLRISLQVALRLPRSSMGSFASAATWRAIPIASSVGRSSMASTLTSSERDGMQIDPSAASIGELSPGTSGSGSAT